MGGSNELSDQELAFFMGSSPTISTNRSSSMASTAAVPSPTTIPVQTGFSSTSNNIPVTTSATETAASTPQTEIATNTNKKPTLEEMMARIAADPLGLIPATTISAPGSTADTPPPSPIVETQHADWCPDDIEDAFTRLSATEEKMIDSSPAPIIDPACPGPSSSSYTFSSDEEALVDHPSASSSQLTSVSIVPPSTTADQPTSAFSGFKREKIPADAVSSDASKRVAVVAPQAPRRLDSDEEPPTCSKKPIRISKAAASTARLAARAEAAAAAPPRANNAEQARARKLAQLRENNGEAMPSAKLPLDKNGQPARCDTPVYTLSVCKEKICVFEPGRESIITVNREDLNIGDIDEGRIYHVNSILSESIDCLLIPERETRDQLTRRAFFKYESEEVYLQVILPALLLGSRVRDFEQRCAIVLNDPFVKPDWGWRKGEYVEDGARELLLNMPAQNTRNMKLKPLKLKTVWGKVFEVKVKNVNSSGDADRRWIVECEAPPEARSRLSEDGGYYEQDCEQEPRKTKLDVNTMPSTVQQGDLLEIVESKADNDSQPRVTTALMDFYTGKVYNSDGVPITSYKPLAIRNWDLLKCIYGSPGTVNLSPVEPANPSIRLANNGGVIELNPEQAEAVARYNDNSCLAFAVESPPGSGKTMTAAAMAVSYEGDGAQLFLSTANVPVINMALALAKLDYGDRKAIHLISAEREDLMTEETRSPFSVLSLAKSNEELNKKIVRLEQDMECAPNEEERKKKRKEIQHACAPVFYEKYDIFFATVDMILGRLINPPKKGNKSDPIKKTLCTNVRRIVVDEASQLTEAALNALILNFPDAQIVLIGDSKQLPPFRYTPEDMVSELAARPALEVIKDKMNLPVVKLTRVYRASPTLIAHYSDSFYEGELKSCKEESSPNQLKCFGSRAIGSKCLFWKVDKGEARSQGTSKFNDYEIDQLLYIFYKLMDKGYREKDVMIISYYEAQRKRAEAALKEFGEYELLTVDSAQGREKKIVIVLTTRTSVSVDTGEFFNCPRRCNVAVSRHQEALIVLGHPSVAAAPNWMRVLNQNYFRHVEDNKAWNGPPWGRNRY